MWDDPHALTHCALAQLLETARPHPCAAVSAGSCPALLLCGPRWRPPAHQVLVGMLLVGSSWAAFSLPPSHAVQEPQGPPARWAGTARGAGAALRVPVALCQLELPFWGPGGSTPAFFPLLPAYPQLPGRAPWANSGALLCHQRVWQGPAPREAQDGPPGRLRTWRSLGPSAAQWLPVLLVGTPAAGEHRSVFGLENKGLSEQSCG